LAYRRGDRLLRSFYNTTGLSIAEKTNKSLAENLSLTIKKPKLLKHKPPPEKRARSERKESTRTTRSASTSEGSDAEDDFSDSYESDSSIASPASNRRRKERSARGEIAAHREVKVAVT
jgi:hypothetical protein